AASGTSTSRDSLIGLPPFSDSSTANSRERSWRIRAIRNRYFARSDAANPDQPFSNASRAAATARPTSSASDCATSASGSSVAGPVEVGGEPLRAERLVELDEVLHGLLRLPDAAGRLHADPPARLVVHVPDRLEHHERDRERGRARQLPGRRLDEVGAGGHGQ